TAIASLTGYRALGYGANVELLLTDQRSYRSPDATNVPEAGQFFSDNFPYFFPAGVIEIFDSGRADDEGDPPAPIPCPRKEGAQCAARQAGAVHARRGTKGVVPRAAEGVARAVEDLGQFAADAVVARRSPEVAGGLAVLGRCRVRDDRWQRLEHAAHRARRDL